MSVSKERQVTAYLRPPLHNFIVKYSEVYGMSESQAVNQAVKALQDTIPKDLKERIIRGTPMSKNGY